MKFQLIVLGLFNFLHTILRTSKTSDNMKKYLATALALPMQDVLNRRLHNQNKPAAIAAKETITYHFFVLEIGQKKTVDAIKLWRRRKCC